VTGWRFWTIVSTASSSYSTPLAKPRQPIETSGAGLSAQRDELRAEIVDSTRQGWQLILAGIALQIAGTTLGMFA
jgi:hypothetical protein